MQQNAANRSEASGNSAGVTKPTQHRCRGAGTSINSSPGAARWHCTPTIGAAGAEGSKSERCEEGAVQWNQLIVRRPPELLAGGREGLCFAVPAKPHISSALPTCTANGGWNLVMIRIRQRCDRLCSLLSLRPSPGCPVSSGQRLPVLRCICLGRAHHAQYHSPSVWLKLSSGEEEIRGLGVEETDR